MSGQLAPEYRKNYILGGNATVTLVSKRTDDHFTYRVRRAKTREGQNEADVPLFVSVLTGPDNQRDYQFIGTIFPDGTYRYSYKSQLSTDAPSVKAWDWTWHNLNTDRVEVWHSGMCSRCGRELTDPESIARGLGPTCAERMEG
ncbi:MAG: DUF6011 domain-containing protein [Anaerolineae bacterium]